MRPPVPPRPRLLAVAALLPALIACSDADAPAPGSQSTMPELAPLSVYFVDAAGETSRMLRWTEGVEGFATVRPRLPDASRGLAWSGQRERLYWTSRGEDVLLTGTLDGPDIETLPLQGLDSAYAVIEAPDGGSLFLSDYGRDEILRVDLDGTTAELLAGGLVAPRALAVDEYGTRLWWVDRGAGSVQELELATGSVRTLVDSGLPAPYGIVWDAREARLLVADAELGSIFRLDPAAPVPVLEEWLPEAGTHPSFLAIDEPTRTLYWTDNRDNVLRRMPLEGGDIEVLVDGLAGPRGLVLFRTPNR